MAGSVLLSASLSDAQFRRISDLVKSLCGINLHDGKRELVQARLAKRLRAMGLDDFDDYAEYVRADASGVELVHMLDAISTNLTRFFREDDHFAYLRSSVLPRVAAGPRGPSRRLRVWSAGCSSGEEPYSIAITLAEAIPDLDRWDARILATDLSTKVLARAQQGLYPPRSLKDVSPQRRSRYFLAEGGRNDRLYRVRPELRKTVHFARLNLMESWPMQGPFDAIFCRNVMIYFDKPTQQELVGRYWQLLAPGGTLFIGHSESLTGVKHDYQYVQPTIYQRP